MTETSNIDDLLAERGKTHGDYSLHAAITQRIKAVLHATPYWSLLTDSMKETLEMNAHKIGRILAGNPAFPDHWADIAGYARLVEKQLVAEEAPEAAPEPRIHGAPKRTIKRSTRRTRK